MSRAVSFARLPVLCLVCCARCFRCFLLRVAASVLVLALGSCRSARAFYCLLLRARVRSGEVRPLRFECGFLLCLLYRPSSAGRLLRLCRRLPFVVFGWLSGRRLRINSTRFRACVRCCCRHCIAVVASVLLRFASAFARAPTI